MAGGETIRDLKQLVAAFRPLLAHLDQVNNEHVHDALPYSAGSTASIDAAALPDANEIRELLAKAMIRLAAARDLTDAVLGMPRDLNADSALDGNDHAGDYTILPVRVRIEWTGINGDRFMEMATAITEF